MSWPLPTFITWISKQVKGIVGIKEKEEGGKASSQALRWMGSSMRKQSTKVAGSRPGSLAQVLVQPSGGCPFPGVKDVSAWPSVTPSGLTHSLSTEEAPGSHECTPVALGFN